MKGITILGATGSIGLSTLSVIEEHLDKYRIVALTADTNVSQMLTQCQKFHPHYAVMYNAIAAEKLQQELKTIDPCITVLSGSAGLETVVCLPEVDIVMAAIVGAAGLLPTLSAVRHRKRVLLANKEPLVMAGQLFMTEVKNHQALLLPVDSEHNAIFQCLPSDYVPGQRYSELEGIYLTASGGPFRHFTPNQLSSVTPEQACAHPIWSMGPKISVDSATMMNKGLEVIEASWLFGLPPGDIHVLLHPQSIVHSFVAFKDGAFLAQLGDPDMRIPIAYALAWPNRLLASTKRLNLYALKQLDFEPLLSSRFPCLNLAYEAMKRGGTLPAVLNAANEVAVQAFLKGIIAFTDIFRVVEEALTKLSSQEASQLSIILAEDEKARLIASEYIAAQCHTSSMAQKSFDRNANTVENTAI
jgi:1-deoxy-D-xylulose-5-phosphate reductoisomerase